MTTLRIEMANNSDARALRIPKLPAGCKAKHNGGKVIHVHGGEVDLAGYTDALDSDYRVQAYAWI